MSNKIVLLLFFMALFGLNLQADGDTKYPLITEISLINSDMYNGPFPPAKIVIGIDVNNDAYYKLSDLEKVIKGGLFREGFNTISIESAHLFEESGSHIYFIDLKAGELYEKKEIEIEIKLDSAPKVAKAGDQIKDVEYKLSMYVGNRLIISSKKSKSDNLLDKFEIQPELKKIDPYDPLKETDPSLYSIPVLSAVVEVIKLIEGLGKKKEKEKAVPAIQKFKQVILTFKSRDAEYIERDVRATIILKTKDLDVTSEHAFDILSFF